jgi:hypothetical protein
MQFCQFQTILLTYVTNDFLQQGYTPYGPPSPFPHPTTPSDPSTPHVESSQVNMYFAFKSESRLLNMTRSLWCYRVLRVAQHPRCRGEDLPQRVDLPRGRHHLRQDSVSLQVQTSGALPHSRIVTPTFCMIKFYQARSTLGCIFEI